MFHMLTCFNMREGIALDKFQQSLSEYTEHMRSLDLVESHGPVGSRQSDSPMDTDGERDHQYFVMMHFRDRSQCDNAVAYIKSHKAPGDSIHKEVHSKVENPIFICWQDV